LKGNKELAVLFTVLTVMGTVSVAFALKTKDNAIQSANFNYKINSSTSSNPITKTRTKAKSSTVVSNKEESTPVSSEPKAITTHHDAPDGKYYIEMKNILQKPELPTGCEATALAIVLNYLGFSADKCDIVDNYLPKTNSMCSLNNFFIGNPYSKSGLGCYAPVIVKTADSYLSRAGSQYRAQLLTGSADIQRGADAHGSGPSGACRSKSRRCACEHDDGSKNCQKFCSFHRIHSSYLLS
jgi:hypothetical protein